MPFTSSTALRAVQFAFCLALLAACGDDSEPDGSGNPTGPTSSTSGSPEGSTLTIDAVDARVQRLIAKKYPELQQVSDEGFQAAVDDPSIDRSRFQPALNENLTHKCWEKPSTAGGFACIGWYDWPAEPSQPDLTCPGGPQLYYHRGVNHNVAKRTYDADYRLTQRIQLSVVPEYYTTTPDGSGERTDGGYEAYFIDEYATPGPAEADDALKTTIVGRDAYQQTEDGELIWVDYGELVMRHPKPWGQSRDFDIVSGR